MAKWAQTFGSFELFARAQGGRRYFALNLFLDLGFARAEQQALSSSAWRHRILYHFRGSSLLYLPADALSNKMSDYCFSIDEDELGECNTSPVAYSERATLRV